MKKKTEEEKLKRWIKWMKVGKLFGCHQRHDRSFFINGYQFPVCARCFGVILGEIIAIILILFKYLLPFWIMASFMAIMFLDWLVQALKIKESNNMRRTITGIIGGIGVMYAYVYVIVFLFNLF